MSEGSMSDTPNYAEMTAPEFLSAVGIDGKKWTDAFMQLHGDKMPDAANMLGWFCNAIMAGYDHCDECEQVLLIGKEWGSECITPSGVTADLALNAGRHAIAECLTGLIQKQCPGHIASDHDAKVCGHCGAHVDEEQP